MWKNDQLYYGTATGRPVRTLKVGIGDGVSVRGFFAAGGVALILLVADDDEQAS